MIAAVLCTAWGLMFIVQRLALEESPPLWVAAGRVSVAAVVLLPWAPRLGSLRRPGSRRLTDALMCTETHEVSAMTAIGITRLARGGCSPSQN